MSEQVPAEQALVIAERAADLAKNSTEMGGQEATLWQRRDLDFSELCNKLNFKTYIAALGTALLAKATNRRIDAYGLKASDQAGHGSYSARHVVSVLVDVSRRRKFDLGARGREPMNNRPFINNSRITLDMNVQPQAQPALEILCKLCHEVNQLDEKRALVALAAYMVVRAKYVPQYDLEIGKLAIESADQLSLAIQEFVTEKSERGLRAQGCVGGLLDLLYDP